VLSLYSKFVHYDILIHTFQTKFENADMFYRHALSHTDSFPDGNAVKGGCKCLWEGTYSGFGTLTLLH